MSHDDVDDNFYDTGNDIVTLDFRVGYYDETNILFLEFIARSKIYTDKFFQQRGENIKCWQ